MLEPALKKNTVESALGIETVVARCVSPLTIRRRARRGGNQSYALLCSTHLSLCPPTRLISHTSMVHSITISLNFSHSFSTISASPPLHNSYIPCKLYWYAQESSYSPGMVCRSYNLTSCNFICIYFFIT